MKRSQGKSMRVFGPERDEMMEISSLEHRDGNLIIKGKIFGVMPMTAIIRPEEARRGLRLIDWSLAGFLLTFLFRRARGKAK